MAAEREGVVDAIRFDLVTLHETWMELLFPRQRSATHSVLGKWEPSSTADRVKYRLWAALGVPLVAVLYPFLLLGLATRFYSRRFDSAATRIGVVGVVLLAAVVWGALTLIVRYQLAAGFKAVAAASTVAVVASALAVVFQRLDGRPVTVLLAYPMAVTAIVLPPVVAALYVPGLEEVIVWSESVGEWVQNTVLAAVGLKQFFVENFDREGGAYALMWFALSFPLGWVLGGVVTLADLVRPREDEE